MSSESEVKASTSAAGSATGVDTEDIARRYRVLIYEVLEMVEVQSFDYIETRGRYERFRELKSLYDLVTQHLAGTGLGRRFRQVHLLIIESYTALYIARQITLGYDSRERFDQYFHNFRAACEK